MDAPQLQDTEQTLPAEEGPGEQSREERKAARKRGPLSPEARRRKTARQGLHRSLERILTEGTTEEIEALQKRLSQEDGGTADVAEVAARIAPQPPAVAPPAAPPPAPGWPTNEATAKARPLAELVVGTVAACAGLLGVDLATPRAVGAGTTPMNLQAMLTDATAPVLALYSPDFLNTPLGNLAATCAMVASIVGSELAMKRMQLQQSTQAVSALGAGSAAPSVASA